jgi:hypothetical protein
VFEGIRLAQHDRDQPPGQRQAQNPGKPPPAPPRGPLLLRLWPVYLLAFVLLLQLLRMVFLKRPATPSTGGGVGSIATRRRSASDTGSTP